MPFAFRVSFGTLAHATPYTRRSMPPDAESWEYRKAYAINAALTRWGVPSLVRAVLRLLVLPPIILAAVVRAVVRGELRS